MNKFVFIISFILFSSFVFSQNQSNYSFVSLEYDLGKTAPANFNFPETNPQQNLVFSIGKTNNNPNNEWAKQLDYPKTGLSILYADFGNSGKLGQAITVMPFVDFNIFRKYSNKFNLKTGLGASYFKVVYDKNSNVYNKAITTHFTWSFRSFLYYKFLEKRDYNFKVGAGYYHNSNGHVRLPNQGLNSFLISLNSEFDYNKTPIIVNKNLLTKTKNSSQNYFSTRFGLGIRSFSRDDNAQKRVYTFAFSTGKIINKTFKFGVGFYYRFYEDYYDYIKTDGAIVHDFYPNLNSKPFRNATNFGISTNAEIMLNHIGVELELGVNLYKPAYKIDWIVNEGEYKNGAYQLGKLDNYYKLKKLFSSRLGLKYYVLNYNKSPKNNFFIGAFLNANFGQADFSEMSLGYVYVL